MKLKGITGAERHVEKIVLALFALFALGVLVFQMGLVGGRHTVPVGGNDVPLDRALAAVRDRAEQRKARLESDEIAQGVPQSLPDPALVFEEAMASALRERPRALASLGTPVISGASSDIIDAPQLVSQDAPFAPLAVPAPSAPTGFVNESTIDPVAVAAVGPDLASLLPAEQPYDLRSVSVEASFDAAALRSALTTPAQGFAAIPPAVWQSRLELVDVEWSRQRLQPDGSWSAEEVLGPLPARRSLRSIIRKSEFQPADYRALFEQERSAEVRADIRRPAYYAVIAGQPWVSPARAVKLQSVSADEQTVTLNRTLASLRREIQDVERRLEQLQRRPAPREPRRPGEDENPGSPPPPPPPPGGGGGDRGGGGGGGDRGGRDNDSDPLSSAFPPSFTWPDVPTHWLAQAGGGNRDRNPQTPTPPRDTTPDPRKRLESELETLRKRETDLVAQLAALGVGSTPSAQAAEEPLSSLAATDSATITLWTHDLTAKPGETYRYRARAYVTNPLYGQTDRLKEEQRSLADIPVVAGEHSAWSEPIRVAPTTAFFITGATEAGGALGGPGRAIAEVFEFYYGFWRRGTVSLSPGDAVANSIELPALQSYALTTSQTGQPARGEGSPLPTSRTFDTGAFLLDTAASPTDRTGAALAFIRMADGRIVRMTPVSGQDDASSERARMLASATQGAEATLIPENLPPGSRRPNPPGNPPPVPPQGGDDERNPGGPPPDPARRSRN
ncbi:MAG: hypothetical protein SFZ24_08100 [Planctomycetota bacterium]|nr:hypothetical protein [Planctomycetota bacterium]